MLIVVNANDTQKQELLFKNIPENVTILWSQQPTDNADVYFDLLFDENGATFKYVPQLVFVNAVVETSDALQENFVRILSLIHI